MAVEGKLALFDVFKRQYFQSVIAVTSLFARAVFNRENTREII